MSLSVGLFSMLDPLILRPAEPTNQALLRRWDAKPHVIAGRGDDDGFYDWEIELRRRPEWRELLIAESTGRPIGFVQIMDPAREESHYWVPVDENLRAIDIWIGDEANLGRGYGTEIMKLALDRCFADPSVVGVIVDPLADNTRVHRFYERLGFAFIDRRKLGNDMCRVYRYDR